MSAAATIVAADAALPPLGLKHDEARGDTQALSAGVLPIALLLSALHFLNFANYTVIGPTLNPPLARSVLLVVAGLVVLVSSGASIGSFHLRRSWDLYAFCALAFLSAAYSPAPQETLKYAMWLLLAAYVATELAHRVRHERDLVMALLVVLLPTITFAAVVNTVLGPTVVGTGRHFGALGSAHVDTAYALDFVCLFLALRVLPIAGFTLPRWVRLLMWGILAWAGKQVVFGLTRSVWLGTGVAVVLYLFRRSLTLPGLIATLLGAGALALALSQVGLERVLPQAVQDRIEVTEQRIESGAIDPRLQGIAYAFNYALENPQGRGFAGGAKAHNSYMNILLDLGWLGFAFALLAVYRSVRMVYRAGLQWFLFFAIGVGPLLLHAFFETNNLPGQGNFVPLLIWYALGRSTFMEGVADARAGESQDLPPVYADR